MRGIAPACHACKAIIGLELVDREVPMDWGQPVALFGVLLRRCYNPETLSKMDAVHASLQAAGGR